MRIGGFVGNIESHCAHRNACSRDNVNLSQALLEMTEICLEPVLSKDSCDTNNLSSSFV